MINLINLISFICTYQIGSNYLKVITSEEITNYVGGEGNLGDR